MTFSLICRRLIAGVILVLSTTQLSAQSERLLPSSTKGFFSVPDVDALEEAWDNTQFGQLLNDPIMQPFLDDLERQVQDRGDRRLERLGLSWDDLRSVAAGEVAVAVLLPNPKQAAVVVIADVKGKEQEAADLLDQIDRSLTKEGAAKSRGAAAGTTVYNLPKTRERAARQSAFSLQDSILIAADNAAVLQDIVAAIGGGRKNSLASLRPFTATMEDVQSASGQTVPHIRWFVEPFGYADAVNLLNPPERKREGKEIREVLANQGFDAIQGVGGYVTFMEGPFEVLHRTSVFAPAVPGEKERYRLGARMLDFPSAPVAPPQDWVPADVSAFAAFNWNMQRAFDSIGTVIDEMANEPGLFDDVIDSLKTARKGPKVDIRADLVENLRNQATVISDYVTPITTDSERLLIAVEVNNPKVVAEAVRRSMEGDPLVKRREFEGHIIWELIEDTSSTQAVEVEVGGGFDRRRDEEVEEPEEPRLFPHAAVTVANGRLYVASHRDYLEKILAGGGQPLASAADYQAVADALRDLGATGISAHSFTRNDEAYLTTYELMRQGKMPESTTVLGRVLNELLATDNAKDVRKSEIDASRLPPFDQVRDSLGPSGAYVTTTRDGWFVTGITLPKAPAADERQARRPTE